MFQPFIYAFSHKNTKNVNNIKKTKSAKKKGIYQ